MESRGLIEFHYPDGRVHTGPYEHYAGKQLPHRGESVEYDGVRWALYDREDRYGVTVYLFRPVEPLIRG